MQDKLFKIFNKNKNIIIGAIHFPPLFGYEDYPGFDIALKNALEDLKMFQDSGIDGIIIENNYDVPHKIFVEKETAELMEKLGKEIKKQAKVPLGVSVLWNDYKSALLIAKNIGGQFIRVPVFVDSVQTDYGKIYANPKDIINFRKKTNAEDVALYTDIHVKHAKMLEKKSIEQSAKEAINVGSDALIITGKWTGDAPDLSELKETREAVGDFPIIVGSGANEENIKKLFKYVNGAIVSTSLKEGGKQEGEVNVKNWKQRINKDRVRRLVNAIKQKKDPEGS